jgi:GH18 family chitinase
VKASQVDASKYTHLIWSFLDVTGNSITVSDDNQWKDFLAITNVKKLVSIGGAESTSKILPPLQANTGAFVDRIVDFFNKNKQVDGLEIDWEFPSDDQAEDYYLPFITQLRSKLPAGKTLSIALQADTSTGWPLRQMADHLDWFVVMTYEYSNYKDSTNYPRSHVDIRRTQTSFSKYMKLIPADKCVLGLAPYGRGYVLKDKSCRAVSCASTNDVPKAGKCFPTKADADFLSLHEMNDIIAAKQPGTWSTYDAASDSNILIYNNPDAQWYGYMDATTMERRKKTYASWGALGSAEWTVTYV